MSTVLPYLVLVLLIGGLMLMVTYFIRQEGGVVDKLAAFADQRGWGLREHPEVDRAFIFQADDSQGGWEIELVRSGRHQPALTTWKSTKIDWTEAPVLIGAQIEELLKTDGDESLNAEQLERLGGELMTRTTGWGAMPAPGPWGLLRLGFEPADLKAQPVGSEALRQIFSVLSRSATAAEGLLNSEVERLLLVWPEMQTRMDPPLVIANQEGLRVRLPHDKAIQQTDLLDRLVELGLALEGAARN
jgi:hypothetical protein